MILLKENYIFVNPGEKAFRAASNYVNYVELGQPASDQFFLVAAIENNEFTVSARLYDERGEFVCRIDDNSVREHRGSKVQFLSEGGYEVIGPEERLILRLALAGERRELCLLQGRFYDEQGELVAEGNEEDFLIYKPPAVLGKSGLARGIVLESPAKKPA